MVGIWIMWVQALGTRVRSGTLSMFIAICQTVLIAVGLKWVGLVKCLPSIMKSISISIRELWIGFISERWFINAIAIDITCVTAIAVAVFNAILQPVTVRISQELVGSQIDFRTVIQSIAIRVDFIIQTIGWVGSVGKDLLTILDPPVVCVGPAWVASVNRDFCVVEQSISICVWIV